MTTTLGRGPERRRDALRDFLRSRRARLSPRDVGLPASGRRRTPGLRREEVASLAGVGITWYTWLEQGRPITVTTGVLDAVSTALRLDDDERAYLYRLAGHAPAVLRRRADRSSAPRLPEQVRSLVDEWTAGPAYVLDRYWRCLHGNTVVRALFGEVPRLRSCLDGFAAEQEVRRVLPDWDAMAPSLVAEFRADAARYPDDPGFADTVRRLSQHSPDFARLWAQQEVRDTALGEKVVEHPAGGRLSFHRTTVQIADHPDLRVVLLLPQPGTGTRQRLHALLAHSG